MNGDDQGLIMFVADTQRFDCVMNPAAGLKLVIKYYTFVHYQISILMNKLKLFVTCLLLLAVRMNVFSQAELVEKVDRKPGELNISYEKWKLPNGLTLYIHEDHSDPIAHIEVTYRVGSNRETPGKSGFAHFFEHMMFQGSDHVADEEHFRIVSEAGGTMNGTTDRDRTNYFETVPANYLETALWLEADRMGFLLDAVTQKKFENQRDAVKNEKGQNVDNQPYGRAEEKIVEQLYPAGHPYSWTTIGKVEDLNSVTVNDLKNFFKRWYGPNNATIVIAGDVQPAEVVKMIEKYFGPIPKGPDVRKMRLDPPVLSTNKYTYFADDIYLPMVQMVYPGVKNYHPDEAPLDVLAAILGNGNNSIFYKNFIKAEKGVQAAVFNPCYELAGEFTILVLTYPDQTLSETEALIKSTLDEWEKKGISEDDLTRAKAGFESNFLNSTGSIAGKASMIALWDRLAPKSYNIQDEIKRYNKVTAADVLRVYNQYIKGNYAVVLNVLPDANPTDKTKKKEDKTATTTSESGTTFVNSEAEFAGLTYTKPVDAFDRSKKPTPGPAKTPVVPKYYDSKFENGIKVIGTTYSETPTVTVLINIKGGHLLEANTPDKIGVAVITAGLMDESTKNFTAEQISNDLEKLGSSISFNVGAENTSIFVNSQVKNLDATLKLLEEKLYNPKFDENEFKRLRRQLVQSVKSQRNQASSLASRAFAKLLYGDNMPAYSTLGTAKSLENISVKDVQEFYDKYYSPSVASVIVVGDVQQDVIMPKLEFLKKWKAKEVKIPEVKNIPAISKTTIYMIDKIEAPHSEIRVGYVALPFSATGEYYKAQLMNFALGGNFNSRINLNLREDKGFTYGARSYFFGSDYPGVFGVSTSVRSSATDSALVEIFKELNNYRAATITDEELAFTKSSILQSGILDYETSFQKAGYLNTITQYNLSPDYLKQQEAILNKMTKEEILQLAQKYLPTDKMIIVVVGDKNSLKKRLEALGYGKVVELDKDLK
jgi:zinc protease